MLTFQCLSVLGEEYHCKRVPCRENYRCYPANIIDKNVSKLHENVLSFKLVSALFYGKLNYINDINYYFNYNLNFGLLMYEATICVICKSINCKSKRSQQSYIKTEDAKSTENCIFTLLNIMSKIPTEHP